MFLTDLSTVTPARWRNWLTWLVFSEHQKQLTVENSNLFVLGLCLGSGKRTECQYLQGFDNLADLQQLPSLLTFFFFYIPILRKTVYFFVSPWNKGCGTYTSNFVHKKNVQMHRVIQQDWAVNYRNVLLENYRKNSVLLFGTPCRIFPTVISNHFFSCTFNRSSLIATLFKL